MFYFVSAVLGRGVGGVHIQLKLSQQKLKIGCFCCLSTSKCWLLRRAVEESHPFKYFIFFSDYFPQSFSVQFCITNIKRIINQSKLKVIGRLSSTSLWQRSCLWYRWCSWRPSVEIWENLSWYTWSSSTPCVHAETIYTYADAICLLQNNPQNTLEDFPQQKTFWNLVTKHQLFNFQKK